MTTKKDVLIKALKSKTGLDIETFTADEVLLVAGISKGSIDRLNSKIDNNSSKSIEEFLKGFINN